jgi:hypothetical protein
MAALACLTLAAGFNRADAGCKESGEKQGPGIVKLGTIDVDIVETTPIVFNDRLYRFESVRPDHPGNEAGAPYFHFVDVKTDERLPMFAKHHALGCAYTEDGTMYVFGVRGSGAATIVMFWSNDLTTWASKDVMTLDGWSIFNTTVCKAGDRYVMAFEVGAPAEVVGEGFTNRFLESKDLKDWTLLPQEHVFTKAHYSACPSLRYFDGVFYMTYLHAQPDYHFETHLVRSRDLITWESSPLNPILKCSPEDKRIHNPTLSPKWDERITNALNRNDSDMDFCEFNGKVVIYYSWGDQVGNEYLAEARYDGTLAHFFLASFPGDSGP